MSIIRLTGCPSLRDFSGTIPPNAVSVLTLYHARYLVVLDRYAETIRVLDSIKARISSYGAAEKVLDIKYVKRQIEEYTRYTESLLTLSNVFAETFVDICTKDLRVHHGAGNLLFNTMRTITRQIYAAETILFNLSERVRSRIPIHREVKFTRKPGFAVDYDRMRIRAKRMAEASRFCLIKVTRKPLL